MFIFSSDSKKSDNSIAGRDIETIIGKGTALNGNIASNANLRVDGAIEGNIETAGHVIIGSSGVVTGNISASSLDVAGTVTGNVTTVGNLSIHSTGQLVGDVRVKSLNIADGGVFRGRSEMDVHTSVPAMSAPTAAVE